ncbi:MAG TPA: hypothetical protein VFZ78_05700 [Flavisolibacter sp.]
MADKQPGTGARDHKAKPGAAAHSERGNHTKVSMDNRSRQKKQTNRSAGNDPARG